MKEVSADDIAACCLSQYERLPTKGTKPEIRRDGKFEWTILAGAVIEIQGHCHCLSLCSGVKALPYTSISPNGDLLHDSHGEVLSKRAARIWLLKRLISEVQAGDGEMSIDGLKRIFVRVEDLRWSLKADIKLHLYCSTFPCGDASSSILLQYGDLDCQQHKYPLSQTSGEIVIRGRTAMSDSHLRLRTKPGKFQSVPSISMSCTDKMAMWSAVGMQGSILSKWLVPIFFERLVVGVDAMKDATYKTISEAVHECERILHDKLGQAEIDASRPLKVEMTALSFVHSKEMVQAQLIATKAGARISGSKDELDYVPAAGSIVYIRGEKREQIIKGRKQGVVMPKDKTIALKASARSILSKATFFALVKEADVLFNHDKKSFKEATYFETKQSQSSPGQKLYRTTKGSLHGSVSLSAQRDMVNSFVTMKKGQDSKEKETVKAEIVEIECPSAALLLQAPFYNWLVAGESFESFQ